MPKYRRSRSRSRSRSKKKNYRRQNNRQYREHSRQYRQHSRQHQQHSRNYRRSSSNSSHRSYSEYQEPNIQPNFKIEETKTLKIQNCTSLQEAQKYLLQTSIQIGTSVPDDIELRQSDIYIKYPSTQVSSAVLKYLQETVTLGDRKYQINFHPYRKIDLNLAYDWFCQNCQYKNFARRNKCYRCEAQKTITCKQIYNSTATYNPKKIKPKDQNINNCSLMIRGPVIIRIEQEYLLDIFQKFSSVKDIRMIKNRMTGQNKDFAFIEFYSPQQTAIALKSATAPNFRIQGQKVSVMYSRNKSDDEYLKQLPFEKKDKKWKQKKNDQPIESYYNKQRQIQIEIQKQRPLITMDQLKQKVQQQNKKKAHVQKQMTAQQNKRRQAEMMAKQWEKQQKIKNTIMYICSLCRRKFANQQSMKQHEQLSKLHKFNLQKQSLAL